MRVFSKLQLLPKERAFTILFRRSSVHVVLGVRGPVGVFTEAFVLRFSHQLSAYGLFSFYQSVYLNP